MSETKNHVKSAEQKVIEMATAEYISRLRALLGANAQIKVSISGVPKSKLGNIAECAMINIKNRFCMFEETDTNYIRKPFAGEGYSIEEISE